MARLTKTQKKRMVKEIESKTKKLFMFGFYGVRNESIVDVKDMAAIEKLCKKFMNRIG